MLRIAVQSKGRLYEDTMDFSRKPESNYPQPNELY